ncbi:glutamine synthetase family protein [Eubacteriales bacterium OttesenSCG-928-M02]|nr:glutamine synthetase family protein [Eubacteriales bacterium OttesenSCG-928-M02]
METTRKDYTANEVLQFVQENDVKFVRLMFCDLFGTMKNIAIMAEELPKAFLLGVSFDASAVDGFLREERSDLFLFPDPSTLTVLPWRPQQGRVVRLFCDIRHPDGNPFEGDSRHILSHAVEMAAAMGYTVQIGSECEFYLFEQDEKGLPTTIPQDRAGYLDFSPLDKGENVRREVCYALEAMGMRPEGSHHEKGPGQNEIDFTHADPLTAADNTIMFKSTVKTIAQHNGLFASFLPKPLFDKSGNGLHVNISLYREGENIFQRIDEEGPNEAKSFVEGVLTHIKACTVFFNAIPNSYLRFGAYAAPKHISWSHENRAQLVRIPAQRGEQARMEVRSPDSSCNPYLAYTLLILAGLWGMKEHVVLRPAHTGGNTEALETLPPSLGEAIALAKADEFINEVLTKSVREAYWERTEAEWEAYQKANDSYEWTMEQHFPLY